MQFIESFEYKAIKQAVFIISIFPPISKETSNSDQKNGPLLQSSDRIVENFLSLEHLIANIYNISDFVFQQYNHLYIYKGTREV